MVVDSSLFEEITCLIRIYAVTHIFRWRFFANLSIKYQSTRTHVYMQKPDCFVSLKIILCYAIPQSPIRVPNWFS